MNTLIGIGTLSAFLFSAYVSWFPKEFIDPNMPNMEPTVFFEASVNVIVLVMLGKYLEENAKTKAGNAIKELMNLAP